MTNMLVGIIDAHMDATGARQAEIARRMDVAPQTISAWRRRGVKDMPAAKSLKSLSDVTGVRYTVVIEAALFDAGYLPEPESETNVRPLRVVGPTGPDEGSDDWKAYAPGALAADTGEPQPGYDSQERPEHPEGHDR